MLKSPPGMKQAHCSLKTASSRFCESGFIGIGPRHNSIVGETISILGENVRKRRLGMFANEFEPGGLLLGDERK